MTVCTRNELRAYSVRLAYVDQTGTPSKVYKIRYLPSNTLFRTECSSGVLVYFTVNLANLITVVSRPFNYRAPRTKLFDKLIVHSAAVGLPPRNAYVVSGRSPNFGNIDNISFHVQQKTVTSDIVNTIHYTELRPELFYTSDDLSSYSC